MSHTTSVSITKQLLKLTFVGRRSWIQKSTPSVKEIVEKFPQFHHPSHVCFTIIFSYRIMKIIFISQLRRELIALMNMDKSYNFIENVCLWVEKIISYGRREASNRASVRAVLSQYDGVVSGDHGMFCTCSYHKL